MLKDAFSDFRIITANLLVLIKMAFLGVLSAEIWGFSTGLTEKVNTWVSANNYECLAIKLCLAAGVLLIIYLLVRGVFADAKKILRSYRVDVLLAICFGVWISAAWGGFLTEWSLKITTSLNLIQILTIMAGPFLLGVLVMARQLIRTTDKSVSYLVVDKELKGKENDLLNFASKADGFAERVFNDGSPHSFVFGVDAPWGIGKSTFINFCTEYWEKEHASKVVVYKFSPLQYLGADNLLEVFIDGLIHAIQKDSFIPEIRPLISRYARLLKEMKSFSIFGLTLPAFMTDYSAEEACDDLNAVLGRFPKKVIIVIDDLDRISFAEIKDILFVIRKSFSFPNISYVLCYDTENIGALEAETPEIEKVGEFLEKFVNIKISIYLDREDLEKFVSENLEKTLPASLMVDPLPMRQAVGGLRDIYRSTTYHRYLPFIGDVRKLKRLINTVLMFNLQNTDFKNSDFDKRDLVNLLLIYIHYPNVFRKIYDTETKGGRGFFSLVLPHEDGYPDEAPGQPRRNSFSESTYKNSTYYHEYIEQLPKKGHQRFLLDQVFNVDVRLKLTSDGFPIANDYAKIDRVPEDVRTSLACFNGGWTNGRNLEAYLDLIVNLSKPIDIGQHRFYMSWREAIINKEKTLAEVFADPKFAYTEGEYTREKLWRILVNNARELESGVAADIISYLLDTIPDYSLIELKAENTGTGLRHDIAFFLTRLLNDAGWTDRNGKHSGNMEPYIDEIAEWIFGDGRHEGKGVLTRLSDPARGVLGIYDLLVFRLTCSADRGGDIFDLSRAIAYHANKSAPTQGSTRDIAREEMREISQKAFQIFNERYIVPKKNIFAEIDSLQTADLASKYDGYVTNMVTKGVFQPDEIAKKTSEIKTRIGSFVLYQMANAEISHGAGCGFYDPTGTEDKHGIRDIVNDYMFTCFDPADRKNAEYFIDYLFRNLANAFASAREDGEQYIPSINEFTKVLEPQKLATFWRKHRDAYKALGFENSEKTVMVGKDEASYKKYVPKIYEVLDKHVTDTPESALTEATE